MNNSDINTTHSELAEVVGLARNLRQSSWCVMVVVVSDDPAFLTTFAEWSLKGRLLVWSTRLLVVTTLPLSQLRPIIKDHYTFSHMNTVIVGISTVLNSTSVGVYVHLPYSPRGAKIKAVASWSKHTHTILASNSTLFPEKYNNFYGATVFVPATTYKPLWVEKWEVTSDGRNTLTHLSGMDYYLLEAIAEAMNFTFDVIPINYWSEGLDLTSQRKAFLTPVYHTMLLHRYQYLDFTVGYTYALLSFVMAKPQLVTNWLSLYYPLEDRVWLSILTCLVLVPAVMTLLVRLIAKKDLDEDVSKLSGSNLVQMVGAILVDQSTLQRPPQRNSLRLLLVAWLVGAFVLGASYRGSLVASLTLPKYPPRPETLEDLANTVDRITVMAWGSAFVEDFRRSGTQLFTRLADLFVAGGDDIANMEEALVKNQAHMSGIHSLQQYIAEHFTEAGGSTNLYIGRESFMPGLSAFPIPHDAPYTPQLNWHIRAAIEAGLYDKWTQDMMDAARRESIVKRRDQEQKEEQPHKEASDTQSNTLRALTLTQMLGPILLLTLGLSVATSVFCCEFLLTKIYYH